MQLPVLRLAGAAIMVSAAAFVIVGPNGLWPQFDIDAARAVMDEPAVVVRAPEVAPVCVGVCAAAEQEPVLPVVMPNAPAAVVLDSATPAAAALAAAATAAVGEERNAAQRQRAAGAAPARPTARLPDGASPSLATNAGTPVDVAFKPAPKDATPHAGAATKHVTAKPVAAKPRADDGWASRAIYNRAD